MERLADDSPYTVLGDPALPEGRRPGVHLFGATAIAAHVLLLTPLVGSILAAVNHWRRGDGPAFRQTLFLFAAPSALLLVVDATVSERFGTLMRFANFAWTIAVARRLYFEHQVLVDKHVAAGGETARWYLATLAALGAFLVLAIGLAVAMALTSG
jgi:hypothetical protein